MLFKKRLWIILACIVFVIALAVTLVPVEHSVSLARPKWIIRRDFLRITPIGTSMEEVLGVIEDRKWRFTIVNRERGYFMDGRRPEAYRESLTVNRANPVVVGGYSAQNLTA